MLRSYKRFAMRHDNGAARCGVFFVNAVQWEVAYATLKIGMDTKLTFVKTGLNFY